MLSYFTDLQGSQTSAVTVWSSGSLVTLLIYKVLKQRYEMQRDMTCLVTLLIYKVLKLSKWRAANPNSLVTLLIYKVLKQHGDN